MHNPSTALLCELEPILQLSLERLGLERVSLSFGAAPQERARGIASLGSLGAKAA